MKYFFRINICRKVLQNYIFILLSFISLNIYSQKLTVKVFPIDFVYVFEESRKDSIFNVLIHNIGITNENVSKAELEKVVIEFFKDDKIFQQNTFYTQDVLKSNSQLYQLQLNNMLDKYDFMFHTKDLVGQAKLSNSTVLQKNSGVILRRLFFSLTNLPDSIKIKAISKSEKNTASISLGARNYVSANSFILPVSGSWYAAAGPSAHTHHRWGYMEEFAYDLVQMGSDNLTYKDDYTKPENYYCYGKDVLAVTAGEVVAILNDIDDATIYPKDLPQQEYMKFVQKRQNDLIEKYGMEGISGNSIVLKHADNEYSFYGHLKKGSIRVKPGEKVVRGQIIGSVGNSGNSTEPHLHFQLNEGKSPLNSRSIPIRFANLNWSESFETEGAYIKSGDWIRTK